MGKAIIHIDATLLHDIVRRGLVLSDDFSVLKVMSPTDIYDIEPYHEHFSLLVESPSIAPVHTEFLNRLPTLTPLYQQSFDEQGREQITLIKLTCHINNKEVILFPTS